MRTRHPTGGPGPARRRSGWCRRSRARTGPIRVRRFSRAVATSSAGPIGHDPSRDSPTTRNAGPMSIPNPVGIPGGRVTRNGSPACGRHRPPSREDRDHVGRHDLPLEVRGKAAHRPEHCLRRGLDDPVAEVPGPVVLAGLAPALASPLLGVVHGRHGGGRPLPGPIPDSCGSYAAAPGRRDREAGPSHDGCRPIHAGRWRRGHPAQPDVIHGHIEWRPCHPIGSPNRARAPGT